MGLAPPALRRARSPQSLPRGPGTKDESPDSPYLHPWLLGSLGPRPLPQRALPVGLAGVVLLAAGVAAGLAGAAG